MRDPAGRDPVGTRWSPKAVFGVIAALSFAVGIAQEGFAQTAMNVTLASNDVYRGRSQSADDPAVTLAIGFDDREGFYAGGSITMAAGDRDPRVSSNAQYAGYAWRSGRASFDLGVVHRHRGDTLDPEYAADYFEGYVGVTHGKTSIRAYVSPDYIPGDRLSGYVALDSHLATLGPWSLSGHAGMAFKPQAGSDYHTEADWSLRAGRSFGAFNLSIGIADSTDSDPRPFDGPLVFAELSRAF